MRCYRKQQIDIKKIMQKMQNVTNNNKITGGLHRLTFHFSKIFSRAENVEKPTLLTG